MKITFEDFRAKAFTWRTEQDDNWRAWKMVELLQNNLDGPEILLKAMFCPELKHIRESLNMAAKVLLHAEFLGQDITDFDDFEEMLIVVNDANYNILSGLGNRIFDRMPITDTLAGQA